MHVVLQYLPCALILLAPLGVHVRWLQGARLTLWPLARVHVQWGQDAVTAPVYICICQYVLALASLIMLQTATVCRQSMPSCERYVDGHVISSPAPSDSTDMSLILPVCSGVLPVHVIGRASRAVRQQAQGPQCVVRHSFCT
jgi:hypothetical protein